MRDVGRAVPVLPLSRLAVLSLSIAFASSPALASKPVKRTLTGCVVDKAFYSVDQRAYRIALPDAFDLAPFEGQGVAISGLLYPGDRFEPDEGTRPVQKQKVCPTASIRAIKHDTVVRFRVDAGYAADAGDFVKAMDLIGQAMAYVTPPECDTFTDRATILAQKGDLAAAKKDLAVIRARKQCYVAGKMNPLLLQDVAKAMMAKGDKKGAIEALKLANAACDGSWCRDDITKELAEARK